MQDIQVTVIIPCHNHGRYLAEAAGSALDQSRAVTEVVIIDDGSTDDTPAVAGQLRRRHPGRVRVISQARQGQNKARQRGLDAAAGEYCVMLDADDLLEPQAAELCLRTFEAHPEADAVLGNALIVGPDGRQVLATHVQTTVVPWPEVLRQNPYGVNLGVMCRARALREAGGLEFAHAGCEDWDVWCRMSRCGMKFAAVDAVLGRYRQTGQNHTRNVLHNLRAAVALLDLALGGDNRLRGCGRPVASPIPQALYGVYRNGRVFHSLGLGLGYGLAPGDLGAVAALLTGGRLDGAWCARQFTEGLRFALAPWIGSAGRPASANAVPPVPLGKALAIIANRLAEKGLAANIPELRAAMIHGVRQVTGRRSVLYIVQRLREKLGKT